MMSHGAFLVLFERKEKKIDFFPLSISSLTFHSLFILFFSFPVPRWNRNRNDYRMMIKKS